ncbi:hypothetical protein BC829DRAFT_445648 [Chytridium lagenaria]|nr:hypothetical protein BC829DRAFT_445648 [Chytridium lagenaria]
MASFPGWADSSASMPPLVEIPKPAAYPGGAANASENAAHVSTGEYKTAADQLASLQERLSTLSMWIKPSLNASTATSPVADFEEALRKIEALSSCVEPDPSCSCRKVVDPLDPAIFAKSSKNPTKRKQQPKKKLDDFQAGLGELEIVMDEKAKDLDELHTELRLMGERVIEEIEKRAELQVNKDALQDELEEVTKELFENANMLVSTEARRGHHHEQKVKNLEQELVEIRLQLQMEQLQLRELKVKMDEEAATKPKEEGRSGTIDGQDANSAAPLPRTTIPLSRGDEQKRLLTFRWWTTPLILYFCRFVDFMNQSPSVKLNKLHTIPFMKNTKDDDINPCLRFGGNPRTLTNKLVEAIMMNSISNQHRSSTERLSGTPVVGEGRSRRPTVELDKPHSSSGASTPTQAIFHQRTVLERLSTWTSLATATPPTPSVPLPASGSTSPQRPQLFPLQTTLPFPLQVKAAPLVAAPSPSATIPRLRKPRRRLVSHICTSCRDRLVSVCEFYNFVRHVRQGLYSTRRREDLFLEVLALKRKMFYARAGCAMLANANEKPFGRGGRGVLVRPDSQLLRSCRFLNGDGSERVAVDTGRRTGPTGIASPTVTPATPLSPQ